MSSYNQKKLSRLFALLFKRKIYKGSWPSETSKCRHRLAPFCTGYGVDLGFGGDPIAEHAICVDRVLPYAEVGGKRVQLGGDAKNLYWFRDGVLDFVYSSHLLEDFEGTEETLREWLRILKPGGNLVLYCPNEQRFREYCNKTGQPYNKNHRHPNFNLAYVKEILAGLGEDNFIYEKSEVDEYSWELVVAKKKPKIP
jgi:predicted SAM-dependent methyltransferase